MPSSKINQEARRAAWAATRAAVSEYARNPCAAAEKDVSRALKVVRHMDDEKVRAQFEPHSKEDPSNDPVNPPATKRSQS